MDNAAIVRIFESIADLLELKGDSPFKIRAYQRAARTIKELPVPVGQLLPQGRLKELPGIGEALEKKIVEMATTGRLGFYERLRAEFPEGLLEIMDIPGVGPKIARKLWKELGVATREELEEALKDGRVAALPRLGEKTAQNILHQLPVLDNRKNLS